MDYNSLLKMIEDLRRSVAAPGSPQTPATSGTGLARTYGEFSEVPQGLPRPTGTAVVPYQGNMPSNPSTASAGGAAASAAGGMGTLTPLLSAIMGSIQGDVLNNRPARMYAPNLPAAPSGTVTGTDLGGLSASAPGAPSVPQSQPNNTPPASPQDGAGSIPWWANATGANFGGSVPMPQPRPAAASQPPASLSNGTVPGASGPTSLGGMPLMNPNGSIPGSSGPTSVGGAPLSPPQSQNGSGLIQKMLAYLHQQANQQSPGNNADPSTYGGSSPYNGANS